MAAESPAAALQPPGLQPRRSAGASAGFSALQPPPPGPSTDTENAAARGRSYGWQAARRKPDQLQKLGLAGLQKLAKRVGLPGAGSQAEAELVDGLRGTLGPRTTDGDVDREAMREMVGMAFDLLDADGDGTLTRMEVRKGRGFERIN